MQIPFIGENYDPHTRFLVERARERRSNKEEARMNLVRYGIRELDMALFGIDTVGGEFNLVMGSHKQRKTTFIINVITNIMLSKHIKNKPKISVDTLESGMQPDRYTEQFICNVASRILWKQGHRYNTFCPICGQAVCREFGITPEVLRLAKMTDTQKDVVGKAEEIISEWSLLIFGANPSEGDTRNYHNSVVRAERLVEEGIRLHVVDHMQQYDIGTSQYEKQEMVVKGFGSLVAKYGIAVFMLSQISLTSWREAKAGTGKVTAMGGNAGAQESMSILETKYTPGDDEMFINIIDSRKTAPISVKQPLEKRSGMFVNQHGEE